MVMCSAAKMSEEEEDLRAFTAFCIARCGLISYFHPIGMTYPILPG